jgi:hypothetical protein
MLSNVPSLTTPDATADQCWHPADDQLAGTDVYGHND